MNLEQQDRAAERFIQLTKEAKLKWVRRHNGTYSTCHDDWEVTIAVGPSLTLTSPGGDTYPWRAKTEIIDALLTVVIHQVDAPVREWFDKQA